MLVLGFMVSWNVEAQTDRRLDGTWVGVHEGIEIEVIMNNGSYEEKNNGSPASRGTYTTNNGEMLSTVTHIFGKNWNTIIGFDMLEPKWYTVNEFIIAARKGLLGLKVPEKQINELINYCISPPKETYSVDADSYISSFIISEERVVIIYNRK
jgi:hypothetical protein